MKKRWLYVHIILLVSLNLNKFLTWKSINEIEAILMIIKIRIRDYLMTDGVSYKPQHQWNLIQTFVGPLNYLPRILVFHETDFKNDYSLLFKWTFSQFCTFQHCWDICMFSSPISLYAPRRKQHRITKSNDFGAIFMFESWLLIY